MRCVEVVVVVGVVVVVVVEVVVVVARAFVISECEMRIIVAFEEVC